LGEQADQTSRHWMYYVGVMLPDSRVFWSGEFYPDQTAFMLAGLAAETKRRAQQLARDQERERADREMVACFGPDWMPKPEAAREYITNAAAWIDAIDDLDAGKARWLDERSLRNAANVRCEDREALLERLERRGGGEDCDEFTPY
jgi:hypothetical protein